MEIVTAPFIWPTAIIAQKGHSHESSTPLHFCRVDSSSCADTFKSHSLCDRLTQQIAAQCFLEARLKKKNTLLIISASTGWSTITEFVWQPWSAERLAAGCRANWDLWLQAAKGCTSLLGALGTSRGFLLSLPARELKTNWFLPRGTGLEWLCCSFQFSFNTWHV